MGTISIPQPEYGMSIEDLVDIVARQSKMTEFLVNGRIDSANVREIAGFNVSQTTLKHRSGIVGMSSAGTLGSAVRFWAGNSDPNLAPFRVTQDGTMYATNGNFTGVITGSTITGGTIRTAATGARIEMSADKLQTYNAANKLNGMVWGNVTGFNYGDILFYDADIATVSLERQGTIGWLLSAKPGYTLQIGSNIASGKTLAGGQWDFPNNVFFSSASIAIGGMSSPNSVATTVAGIVSDFNSLLSNLRTMKVIA